LGTSTDELPVSAIDNGLETQGEEVHASDDAHEPAYEQDAEEFDTDDDTIGNA
jgi:NAD(P)H-dependent FMN reductase